MYQDRNGLGLSLKPPAWMRDAFGQIVGSVRIEPPGPIRIPLPGGSGQVVLTTQPTRPLEQAGQFVQQNAGMIGIAAAAALALVLVMGGRGRRG